MKIIWRRFELPFALTFLLGGAAFLLKMCYLSLTLNMFFGLIFLTALYFYVHLRHALRLPTRLLLLVFGALQIDALGNFFRLYGRQFGPIQYDEFSHLTVQIAAKTRPLLSSFQCAFSLLCVNMSRNHPRKNSATREA
jgi:hypothetical protein